MKNKSVLSLCEHQNAQPGKLYVVATPIGNLGDLTLRAIYILETCDCIACETLEVTQHLLTALNISKKHLFIYRNAGEEKSAQHIITFLKNGQSIALVSDAGTPTISDPGYRLIKLCRENCIPVIPIPGANAAVTAISVSGFPTQSFLFLGFLSSKTGTKKKLLLHYKDFNGTLILYESPHRIQKLLETLKAVFGLQRNIFVARELTKINETFYRGLLNDFPADIFPKKGEYVVLIAPSIKV